MVFIIVQSSPLQTDGNHVSWVGNTWNFRRATKYRILRMTRIADLCASVSLSMHKNTPVIYARWHIKTAHIWNHASIHCIWIDINYKDQLQHETESRVLHGNGSSKISRESCGNSQGIGITLSWNPALTAVTGVCFAVLLPRDKMLWFVNGECEHHRVQRPGCQGRLVFQ